MFQETNMTSERSRYLALVKILSRNASVFKSVAHLLKTTNEVTHYSTLKVASLRLYSNAGGEDLETSLNDYVRGDDKVSNYLGRLHPYSHPVIVNRLLSRKTYLNLAYCSQWTLRPGLRCIRTNKARSTNWLHMPTASFLQQNLSLLLPCQRYKYHINKDPNGRCFLAA